jgi:acyl-CoA reductase-like NAD-dependent aldehyde dehydrogenase
MLQVRDPADVRPVVGEVPAMTAAEVAAAYARARAGFDAWRHRGALDRAAVLSRCADLIRSQAGDGAVTLVRENGKTLAEARVEVTKTADFLDYYASFARQPWGEIYAAHRDGVLGHIERAREEGASVIAGGRRPAAATLEHGCYVEPTLIRVAPEQSLWRDEVFGPVLAITTAAGFHNAVRLANDTVYGLAAAVFTTSLTAANTFIDLAEAGQVAVNLPTAGWDVHHPFGGFRDSGSPFKEQGSPGLRFYTRIKTAAVRFAW